jgi:cytochrome oxidase Cu insertion factor (SCO1/SenC/PrrC family)
MQSLDVEQLFPSLPGRKSLGEYNLRHFRTKHLVSDLKGTVERRGVQPGDLAPDFSLTSTDGERVRLSDFRGRPVLLRFGSAT